MDEINDNTAEEVVEEDDAAEEVAAPVNETPDDKEVRLKRLEENAIRQRERTRALKAENEKLKKSLQPVPQKEAPSKTGELDETQLDYLDLKGITESDEIDVITKVIAKTGQTVRQALKDDYVQSKLEKLRADKAVKDATPSATKRGGGGQTNDLALDIARYEQTGALPDDFVRRSAVINAKVDKENTNKPAWH